MAKRSGDDEEMDKVTKSGKVPPPKTSADEAGWAIRNKMVDTGSPLDEATQQGTEHKN